MSSMAFVAGVFSKVSHWKHLVLINHKNNRYGTQFPPHYTYYTVLSTIAGH
jgi:hypothetical protein